MSAPTPYATPLELVSRDLEQGWKRGRAWSSKWVGHHGGTIPGRIAGFQGEAAMARHLRAALAAGPGEPDLVLQTGLQVDVRTRIGLQRDLLILPNDIPTRPYLLVCGAWPSGGPEYGRPSELWFVGWCYGAEGEKLGRWGLELPSPTWLVPQAKLRTPAGFRIAYGAKAYPHPGGARTEEAPTLPEGKARARSAETKG